MYAAKDLTHRCCDSICFRRVTGCTTKNNVNALRSIAAVKFVISPSNVPFAHHYLLAFDGWCRSVEKFKLRLRDALENTIKRKGGVSHAIIREAFLNWDGDASGKLDPRELVRKYSPRVGGSEGVRVGVRKITVVSYFRRACALGVIIVRRLSRLLKQTWTPYPNPTTKPVELGIYGGEGRTRVL